MAQLRMEPKNAEAAPKILRIGIIQQGKIVEERLVRKRENVTIGQSSKNTFVVPASNYLPRSFTLFELTPKGYALNFTDAMDGRVSLGEQVVSLPALRQAGKVQKRGELWHLVVTDKSRGKVVIGDVTVLFQFVAPPPVQPRPQLPPSVRSSLMQNLDWMLVAVVAASFLFHFGFVVYLRNLDFPRKPDIEEIPDRFVHVIVPPKKEEKKVEVAQADKGAEKEKKEAKKGNGDSKPKGPKAPRDPEAEARAAAERRARLAADVQKMGVLKLLGAKGDGGTVADLVGRGDVSADADKVFSQVGGVGVAGSGAGGGLRSAKGAGGTGSLRGGGSLRASGPGDVGTGERGAERVVKAVVKDSAPESVDGTLDASVIVKEIKSRIGAVKACYESGLKRNPNIGGKLTLHFAVSAIGKVTGVDIENDTMHDDEVAGCIKSRVASWRFPAPPGGGTTEFSYPFVFQAAK
jgi:hypothetical protein